MVKIEIKVITVTKIIIEDKDSIKRYGLKRGYCSKSVTQDSKLDSNYCLISYIIVKDSY